MVADNGAVLQWRGERCGLLAVEWLGWFDAGGDAALHDRLHGNVRSVSVAHLEQGVRRLALARSIENQQQLDAIRDAVPTPIHVVRLQVTAAQVEQRVSAAPTEEGRLDYLRVSMEWLSADFLLPGNRPIRGNK